MRFKTAYKPFLIGAILGAALYHLNVPETPVIVNKQDNTKTTTVVKERVLKTGESIKVTKSVTKNDVKYDLKPSPPSKKNIVIINKTFNGWGGGYYRELFPNLYVGTNWVVEPEFVSGGIGLLYSF